MNFFSIISAVIILPVQLKNSACICNHLCSLYLASKYSNTSQSSFDQISFGCNLPLGIGSSSAGLDCPFSVWTLSPFCFLASLPPLPLSFFPLSFLASTAASQLLFPPSS